jgi:hypothetical protein
MVLRRLRIGSKNSRALTMLVAFKNELLSNPINRFGGIPGGPSPESIISFYIYNAQGLRLLMIFFMEKD